MKQSKWEALFHQQLVQGQLSKGLWIEFVFDEDHLWRFDFAWPDLHIAAEVDGGNRMAVISKRTGRAMHTRAALITEVMERYGVTYGNARTMICRARHGKA